MKKKQMLLPTQEQKELMIKNGIKDTANWMVIYEDNISITVVSTLSCARKVLFK